MAGLGSLSPRVLGAGAGLLAAAITIAVILWQLIDAAQPMPTTLFLQNQRAEAVAVNTVSLSAQAALGQPVTLPPAASPETAASAPGWSGGRVELPPGIPVPVRLQAVPAGREAACDLEARPRGRCEARIALLASGGLSCAWRCDAGAASAATP